MFGFFAKALTEKSNHYIDWSRIGELIQSGNHRYSKDELLARGSIIICTAVSTYLGSSLNNSEKTKCSNVQMAIAFGLLGFILSHAIVIYPLYRKRVELSHECKLLASEIHNKLEQNVVHMSEACKTKIKEKIHEILTLSLSTDNHGNASQTWGRRKRLLSEINEKLTPEKFNEEEWISYSTMRKP